MPSEELPGALQFLLLPPLIQQIRGEAAVEISVDVATVGCAGLGIADLQSQREPRGIQQILLITPLVHQPGPIDFVAMGATHHQHIAAGHHKLLNPLTEAWETARLTPTATEPWPSPRLL